MVYKNTQKSKFWSSQQKLTEDALYLVTISYMGLLCMDAKFRGKI